MPLSHLVGLFLWRTGLLLAGSYTLFRIARWVLTYVDLPVELEWGVGLALTGAALVLASFVAERIVDRRAEGSLSD